MSFISICKGLNEYKARGQNYSLLLLLSVGKPHTGRMHQIRVHLQWLGHPIVNDPIYNHKTAWGEGKGKKGTEIDVTQVRVDVFRSKNFQKKSPMLLLRNSVYFFYFCVYFSKKLLYRETVKKCFKI